LLQLQLEAVGRTSAGALRDMRADANQKSFERLHRASALVLISAILFCLFFQLNKSDPLRGANPCAQDPYDAIGSFAVQAALLVGFLSYARARAVLPDAIAGRVDRLASDSMFARVPWIDPRRHPWRFACLASLLAGTAIAAAQLTEGLPPNLAIGLLLAGIFISGELIATVAGFALLGGYLGVRPAGTGRK